MHARTRAETVVAATTELLGLSSTRRSAVPLAAVPVCARVDRLRDHCATTWLNVRSLAAVTAQQEALAAEVDRLTTEGRDAARGDRG